jgi:hypothetical protein
MIVEYIGQGLYDEENYTCGNHIYSALNSDFFTDMNFFVAFLRRTGLVLLKEKEDFTETEIKYRKYKTNDAPELIFNGEEFYVARNWGIGNIHKLINKYGQIPRT